MERVLSLVQTNGASAGFATLWDILLLEAHGVTMGQAAETGLTYDVRDYAITHEQARTIFNAMVGTAGGGRLMLQGIGRMWLDKGPASFDPAAPWRQAGNAAEDGFLSGED